jgi:phage terminase large subunit GpA-like protein
MLEHWMTQAMPGGDCYRASFQSGLMPDPPLWVDEWADQYMMIPPELGSAEPGRYRTARTPFARDVMRALSPEHKARVVVVKGASQLLKTQVGLNWACAMIAGNPANMIILQPTDKLAKRVSSRFDKTAKAVGPVRNRLAAKKSRDNRNTIDTKEFRGGTLWILTGRSASNLSEASVRYVYADEVDRILRELKGEGDPISLVEKRQSTFGSKAKSYYTSSPTEEGSSRIDELYRQGNQHTLWVPCPHCGEYQTLEWENLHIDPSAGKAWMACTHNGCIIEEHAKPWMLERHEWRPQANGDGDTWSYEISYLYAPLGWDSWWTLAKEHRQAEEAQQKGDIEKMQVFWNTRLARCWTVVATRVKPQELQARAEAYPRGIAPAGVCLLTAACDVQGNRIECQMVGWGPGPTGLEAWLIDTHMLYGDPTLPEVWRELDDILRTPVQHATGALLYPRTVCIDSGDGDSTQEVYQFVRLRKARFFGGHRQTVIAVKGASTARKPIIAGRPGKVEYSHRGKPIHGGAEVWLIGTDTAKDWLFNRLALPGQVAIHTSKDFPIDVYEQILSEAKVTRWERGKKTRRYELIKRGSRNEQLDMLVYNLAAAHHLGLPTYTEQRWLKLAGELAQADLLAAPPDDPAPTPAPIMPPPVRQPRPQPNGFGSESWNL